MKVLQINTVYGEGSTGRIALMIHDACKAHGIICLSAYRRGRKGQKSFEHSEPIGYGWDSRVHGWLSWLTMFKGTGSVCATARFLRRLERDLPDVIHLHNLHGSYINLPMLFGFIRRYDIPVVWTLHDCWAFTAICPHFSMAACERWKTGCGRCPQKKQYSASVIDWTRSVLKLKRSWFCSVRRMTLVAPSFWLEGLVRQSFLRDYPVKTIHNGIDLQVFSPVESDFREKYGLLGKKIVLGVAFGWGQGKGLDVFEELAHSLNEDYRIVLVGTDARTAAGLPESILCIHRTHDQRELAAIYTAADVFANPTREEVLGLVNIEALACGTPVVTFHAGGSPECIDASCGVSVPEGDVGGMKREIVRICTEHPYAPQDCRRRAEQFDKTAQIEEYIALYMTVAQERAWKKAAEG